ncbi:hypothetical protein R1sor_015118 [Riccia sorocarpa]|uniref:Uncharacterized protein n=1 Tax=Riccia sorocarpa TaxID=122646 RepID=A0ABD3HF76_9MARC
MTKEFKAGGREYDRVPLEICQSPETSALLFLLLSMRISLSDEPEERLTVEGSYISEQRAYLRIHLILKNRPNLACGECCLTRPQISVLCILFFVVSEGIGFESNLEQILLLFLFCFAALGISYRQQEETQSSSRKHGATICNQLIQAFILHSVMSLRSASVQATPLLLLITSSGFTFVVGALTFFLLSDFYHHAVLVHESQPQKVDERFYRVLPVDLIQFRTNCTEGIPVSDVRDFIIDNMFDGTSPYEGFPNNETAELTRTKRIKGWGAEAPVFERLIREVQPKVILELGSFLGASAIHMGTVVRQLGLNSTILCVDDFRGWPGFRAKKFKDIRQQHGNIMLLPQFLRNVKYMNLTDLILPVPFSTTGAISYFCELGIRPDLIEVDAAHDFHSAWLDINAAYATLNTGGVMFGHDYFNRANEAGVRRAVDLFAKLNGLRVEPDGKHWILRTV